MSVSYTHLDVYKRQMTNRRRTRPSSRDAQTEGDRRMTAVQQSAAPHPAVRQRIDWIDTCLLYTSTPAGA